MAMKKTPRRAGLALLAAMFLLACEGPAGPVGEQGPVGEPGEPGGQGSPGPGLLVTGVDLSQNGTVYLVAGASTVVYATVSPDSAVFQWVEWASGDPGVVGVTRVPRSGVFAGPESAVRLDALSPGTSVVTATSMGAGGGVISASVTVTVRHFPSLHVGIAAGAIHRTVWAAGVPVSLTGPHGFAGVGAQVRGRGNTTWWNMGEKRPFRVRFDQVRPMFGSAYAARDWTVIAAASDHTLVRQYAAYFLGRMLCYQAFAPAGHFVHVYLDGEYRGLYMLSDQMQVNQGRAELRADFDPAMSEFFLEWCMRSAGEEFHLVVCRLDTVGGNDVNQGVHRLVFVVEFPGSGLLRQNLGHMEFVTDFLTRVDRAVYGGDYGEVSGLIDVASFVDFYLVQELFKNHDSWWSSLFFQLKQTPAGPRLFAGPLWDFDLSAGNAYFGRASSYAPEGVHTARLNPWFRNLMEAGWFRQRADDRWGRIRDNEVAAMVDRIWYLTGTYRRCFERNFERWPDKLGQNVWDNRTVFATPPTVRAIPDFIGNVEYLTDWLARRKTWMDGFLAPVLPAAAMLVEPAVVPPAGGF